jgi:hypothetical protein
MATKIQLRRDLAASWTSANPTLAQGEPGLETDTGKIKYGDGTTAWADLDYAGGGDTLNAEGGVVVTAGSTNYWLASQRRNSYDTNSRGVRHDSEGNVYALTATSDANNLIAVITKYSPTGAVTWQHTINDFRSYSLAVDSSDCAYIAGENADNNNSLEVFKFSTAGEVLWKKNYESGYLIGECFIEERTSTRVTLVASRDSDEGDYGVLVLDINSTTGEVVTQKLINPGGPDDVGCSGIDTDADGNVVITGYYYDSQDDKNKMFVEKLNSSLSRVWAKSLDTETSYNMSAGDCASDSQGNVYAVAYYSININNVDAGNGVGTVGILVKLNSLGVVQWTRRLGPGPCGNGVVGLTATAVGDLYLATITIEPSTNPLLDDVDKYAQGDVRMIVCRYDTAGDVVWQRYIDDSHTWEYSDNFRGQAISVYNDKFVTDYYGEQTNNRQINFSNNTDEETDCFIVQLPTDGTDLEIGSMSFKASRIPGRFITQAVTTSPLSLDTFENTITVANSSLAINSLDRIANSLFRSESYDYVFGADGTLTIPNDGDIKLTQSQIGFMSTMGGVNNNNSSVNNYAVATDSDGNMYVGGEESSNERPYVAKISPEGARLWSVTINETEDDNVGSAQGVTIDPTTGDVLVVCEMWGNYVYASVVTIDPDTGRILSNREYRDSTADVYLNEVAFLSTGDWVAGGSKNGEFSAEQTATPITGSTTQKLVVARSEIEGNVDSNWQIGGTGFSVFENISSVERYTGLTGTVRQGSGAAFTVNVSLGSTQATITTADLANATVQGTTVKNADNIVTPGGFGNWLVFPDSALRVTLEGLYTMNQVIPVTWAANSTSLTGYVTIQFPGDGTFQITPVTADGSSAVAGTWYFNMNFVTLGSYSVLITGAGTNYLAGHKVKVLGTALGGTTPENDCIITVAAVDMGGFITSVSNTGTPNAAASASYPAVAHANYNVGSGFTLTMVGPFFDNLYTNYNNFIVENSGSNYVTNDVVTFAGTGLGGASTANDLIWTVYAEGGSVISFQNISGTAQSTNWNIATTTNVDFDSIGTWQLTQPLSRENLLLTADWQRTYGTNTGSYTDKTNAIAIDSGNNIITVGQGYGIRTGQSEGTLATVYKFNSTGTLQWSKKLNNSNDDCYAKSVTAIGTDIYVTHENNDIGETVITKLSANGTVQWQRKTDSNGNDDSVVVPAGDGDILIMAQAFQDDVDDDCMKIIKMTSNGETVYKRWFSAVTNDDTRLNNGRSMSVRNGYFHAAGHYDTNNNTSCWLAKLPVDGTGTGQYGQFRYEGVNAESGNYLSTGIMSVGYFVDEIDLSTSYAGALTVEPYVDSTDQGLDVTGNYSVNSFYENYYLEVVRDTDGGCIVFPDGTTQSTSATDIPQRIYRGEHYTLGLKDRGHHILCVETGDDIRIPYYARVPFPVGTQIVFVNDSGGTVNIGTEGGSITVLLSGSNGGSYSYFYMNEGNVATLLNIGRDRWVFFGDVADN